MDSDDGIIFSDDDFTARAFDVFEDMRRSEQLVDFKITLENHSVTGHRQVLAARIPHFREIFCTSQEEIMLNEIDPDVVQSVINFAYSGKIKITLGNAVPLIKASKTLQLTRVSDACWEYLEKSLHSNNVLEFRRFAEDHGCTKFLEAADKYIRQNFEEFSNSEGFADLPFHQFKEIISRDDIKVSTEEKVFEAVIRWTKSFESERRDLLPELLSAVRMYFLTPHYLINKVSAEELVRSSLPCRDLVEEAKNYHLLPDEKSKFCRLPSQRRFYEKKGVSPPLSSESGYQNKDHRSLDVVPRRSLVYSVYRSSGDGFINVKQFDPEGEKWLHVSSYGGYIAAVVSLGEVIYIFDGSLVYTFELSTNKWSSFCCPKEIDGSGSVACNGKIYFFGGSPSHEAEVDCFDPRKKEFLEESRMTRGRKHPGVAVLSSSRGNSSTAETFIYVTGGVSGINVFRNVERYNPETKIWSNVPWMLFKRFEHGCCHLEGKIYVCGGFEDYNSVLSSAEMFDPLTNQWNVIASMTKPRSWLSVTSHEGKIYAWGIRPPASLHGGKIEMYDPKTDEWKIGPLIVESRKSCDIYLVKSYE